MIPLSICFYCSNILLYIASVSLQNRFFSYHKVYILFFFIFTSHHISVILTQSIVPEVLYPVHFTGYLKHFLTGRQISKAAAFGKFMLVFQNSRRFRIPKSPDNLTKEVSHLEMQDVGGNLQWHPAFYAGLQIEPENEDLRGKTTGQRLPEML